MVLDGISFRHRNPPIVFDKNLTTHRYINKVLRPAVFAAHLNVNQFQQDDVRLHAATS